MITNENTQQTTATKSPGIRNVGAAGTISPDSEGLPLVDEYEAEEMDDMQPSESQLAFDFEIEMDAFSFEQESNIETRIIKPPKTKEKVAIWKNAVKTAAKIDIHPGMAYFGIIDGRFIFGDLIEALFTQKLIRTTRLDISTLTLSQDNVDSLATLIKKNYVKEMNLIVSDYFYQHERRELIPYIYQELDIDNRFQMAAAGLHTKIVTAKLTNGIHLVIHGSANLRSSGNIEQIHIQDSREIYEFMTEINDKILQEFKTINKSVRRNKLWQALADTTNR